MKALVTGGAGFIGSHLCERLLKEGFDVICLDNFDPYYEPKLKRANIEGLLSHRRFELLEGDILDQRLIREVISKNIDCVFHYAAQAGVRVSIKNPLKVHSTNATGTLNLLQACVNSSVRKIINASSSSVYGKIRYLPFDENHPTAPISPYGVSKVMAEHYGRVLSETKGLNVISLRLFTVYGPRMRPDLAISIFVRKALDNRTIEIFGNGAKTRDFTYIDDVVEANLAALRTGDTEIYNIGSGKRISINELAGKIIEIIGAHSNIIHISSQVGDAEHTWADITKAKKELEWEPKFDLEQGIKMFINWQKTVAKKRPYQ